MEYSEWRERVLFWEDFWLREKPLIWYDDLKRAKIWAMANQDVWVKDYIKIIEGVKKWTLIHSLILEIES